MKKRTWKALLLGAILATSPITGNAKEEEKTKEETATGNSHAKIWGALTEAGYSEQATAGILGNLEAESLCDSRYIQGGRNEDQFVKGAVGIGIAQWTSGAEQDRLFEMAEEADKEWGDLDLQIDFLLSELTGSAWEGTEEELVGFKASEDIKASTIEFMQKYCKPQDMGEDVVTERLNFAKEMYNKFGTKEVVQDDKKEEPAKGEAQPEVDAQADMPDESIPVPEEPQITENTALEVNNTGNVETRTYTSNNIEATGGIAKNNWTLGLWTCVIGGAMMTGYVLSNRAGWIDMVEDEMILKKYRKEVMEKYGKRKQEGN